MSPRRDPSTGKFVSGSGVDAWHDVESISGALRSNLPAADLAGGTGNTVVNYRESEIVDFTNILDNDEIFEVLGGHLVATLAMPTTATAEGSAQLNWVLRGDPEEGAGEHPPFYGFGPELSDGIADIRQQQYDDNDRLAVGHLTATPSFLDTVNALGGGGDDGFDRAELDFSDVGTGPQYDADDEIGIPHTFYYDGVSDHAISAGFDLHLFGRVHDLDDC